MYDGLGLNRKETLTLKHRLGLFMPQAANGNAGEIWRRRAKVAMARAWDVGCGMMWGALDSSEFSISSMAGVSEFSWFSHGNVYISLIIVN